MKTLAKTITHALAAAGLAAAAATPSLAAATSGEPATRMTLTVSAADLDLATPEGQRKLDNRVEKAVRTVCRITNQTTGTRIISRDALACLAKARRDARAQVAALKSEVQRGG
jgi:UrcA family protein